MSKTDKTRPFRIKQAEKGNHREVHNHATRPLFENGKPVYVDTGKTYPNGRPVLRMVMVPFEKCDLPADPLERDDRHYQHYMCHWTYSTGFINSGEARCGCRTCSQQTYFKDMNRKARKAAKKAVARFRPNVDDCDCKCHLEHDAQMVPFCTRCDSDYSNLCSGRHDDDL